MTEVFVNGGVALKKQSYVMADMSNLLNMSD